MKLLRTKMLLYFFSICCCCLLRYVNRGSVKRRRGGQPWKLPVEKGKKSFFQLQQPGIPWQQPSRRGGTGSNRFGVVALLQQTTDWELETWPCLAWGLDSCWNHTGYISMSGNNNSHCLQINYSLFSQFNSVIVVVSSLLAKVKI